MSGTEKRSAGLRRDDRGPLVEGLPALPRSTTRELRTHWQKLIGSPPPGGLSRDLLMRVIADQLQEAALGGLPPAAKRRLAALARNAANGTEAPAGISIIRLKPGSKLVRAWRGKTHTVLVLADGFEHEGQRYASLTQIASAVTGHTGPVRASSGWRHRSGRPPVERRAMARKSLEPEAGALGQHSLCHLHPQVFRRCTARGTRPRMTGSGSACAVAPAACASLPSVASSAPCPARHRKHPARVPGSRAARPAGRNAASHRRCPRCVRRSALPLKVL